MTLEQLELAVMRADGMPHMYKATVRVQHDAAHTSTVAASESHGLHLIVDVHLMCDAVFLALPPM
jgi:hypothetical protein